MGYTGSTSDLGFGNSVQPVGLLSNQGMMGSLNQNF